MDQSSPFMLSINETDYFDAHFSKVVHHTNPEDENDLSIEGSYLPGVIYASLADRVDCSIPN